MKMIVISSAMALLFAIPAQSAEVVISTGHHHRHHVEKIINDNGQRLHHRHHGQQAFNDSGRRHHHKHVVGDKNGY